MQPCMQQQLQLYDNSVERRLQQLAAPVVTKTKTKTTNKFVFALRLPVQWHTHDRLCDASWR